VSLQKTHRDGADVTWRSSWFQTQAAATGKVQGPTVDNRVRRSISDYDDADRIDLSVTVYLCVSAGTAVRPTEIAIWRLMHSSFALM